jgi:hypothetical protein
MPNSSYKIEVHTISNRILLDEFIQMWENVLVDNIDCTIKVLTMDYPEKKFVLNNGIKVEYIKQRTSWKTTFMNQAWARNELLCYSDVNNITNKYILFFDDWQKPEQHILIKHLEYLKMEYSVCGKRFECDKDGNNCKNDYRDTGGYGHVRQCGYGEFWTCNSSTKLDYIMRVNGFDNRFNGGTAGEDYDMAMRISKLGGTASSFIYNPNAISYHYCHDHLSSRRKDNIQNDGHSHNTSDYKYIPEYKHFGKWDNMDGKDKYEFWWEGPIKYYKCKICDDIGILDSMQVYYHNRDNNIIRVTNGLEQVRETLKKVIG